MIEIRQLSGITDGFLRDFQRAQHIRRRFVRAANGWQLMDADEWRDWDDEKRAWAEGYLREQLERGGAVLAAYEAERLMGFAALDGVLRGETARYANLTMLFIDRRFRGRGAGSMLFEGICGQARRMQAERLFISAIPCEETISFYFRLGCADAREIPPEYVDSERDRFIERALNTHE